MTPARAKEIFEAAREAAKIGPWSDQLEKVMRPGEREEVNAVWQTMSGSSCFVDALFRIMNWERDSASQSFLRACRSAHVRSAVRRKSKPTVKYWKNHEVPLEVRVPLDDQTADDWEEFDPRDHKECPEFSETPA